MAAALTAAVLIRLVVAAAFLAIASPALANQIQVGYSTTGGGSYGPYQTGQGGEFTLNDVNPDGWLDLSGYSALTSNFGPAGISSFQSFCIEKGEFISPYSATYNAQLNTNAMNGGVGPAGDPVSVGTGWLYSQFAQGTLSGYAFSGTTSQRQASAAQLQAAIWWLEGDANYNGGNPFMAAVVSQFGSKSAAKANDVGSLYHVFAINLWTGSDPTRNRAQDQLYFAGIPQNNTTVPDGGTTLTLLGIGLLGVALLARRVRTTDGPTR